MLKEQGSNELVCSRMYLGRFEIELPPQAADRPQEHLFAAAEAASLAERSLIVVADLRGVRVQRSQWWMRGT